MAAKKPTAKTNADLKKSGIAKLAKIGKTTSEAHIMSAVRQGKITKYEAAAIDPKKFKSLLEPAVSSKTVTIRVGRGGGMFGTMKNR